MRMVVCGGEWRTWMAQEVRMNSPEMPGNGEIFLAEQSPGVFDQTGAGTCPHNHGA